jgi:peroxiredoxin
MKPRILVLPLAAVLIVSAVTWKQQQTHPPPDPRLLRYSLRPAPSFEATETTETDRSGFFRLERYLGRQALLLVFFDGEAGAEASQTLRHLRSHSEQIDRRGVMVVAVSSALPQQNEKLDFPDSFRFVTDLPPIWEAHRRWDCFDESTEQPLEKVFFVDRAGNVTVSNGLPVPLENETTAIDRVLGIEAH